MKDVNELKRISSQIRRDIVRMIHSPKSGHSGGSLGCADFLVALYFSIMEYNSANFTMDGKGEDVFFLSNGHIAPVWYSVLARAGFFEIAELATLRQLNTRLQGHPTPEEKLPGIRIASGSLGQGLSVGIGAALSKKLNNDNHIVYTLHGDGELEEGQIWEAAMFAVARKVDNLIATIDYNGQQIDGPVDKVIPLGDLHAKWESFGWIVFEMQGHDFKDILDVMEKAKSLTGNGKPIVILMHTIMGKGVDFMENNHKWHGVAPNDEQLKSALNQLEETLGDY